MIESLPADWRKALGKRLLAADLRALDLFVKAERKSGEVYPPDDLVFEAFRLTPFRSVRAVIVGQDPYHEPGQAHGLAYSTLGEKLPRSLLEIRKELRDDCRLEVTTGGSLEPWARHGILLLNTVLTVRRGEAMSHAGHGWEKFTDAVVDAVAAKRGPIVFLLWGRRAQAKGSRIDRNRHIVIESPHPSPYSSWRGFVGSRPFGRANEALGQRGAPEIDWCLE